MIEDQNRSEIDSLRADFLSKRQEAETAARIYYEECKDKSERREAYIAYQRIRHATRIYR